MKDDIWKNQILSLKLESQKNKRSYYENIMLNYSPLKLDFLNIGWL